MQKNAAAAVENAKEAAALAQVGGRPLYVALDVGPTGKLLKPLGDLDFEDCVAAYAELIRAGEQAGADLIAIETMSDLYELKAAVLAAKENSSLPVFATVAFDSKGKLLTGGDAKAVVALLEGLGVDALGMNCGFGPDVALPFLEELLAYSSLPVILKPNAGLPRNDGGKTVYDVTPKDFGAQMRLAAKLGACVLGRMLRHDASAPRGAARGLRGPSSPSRCPKRAHAGVLLQPCRRFEGPAYRHR